ncbi:DcaP family trimeric outer membrane transporter, partial [Parabacteroides merdae]
MKRYLLLFAALYMVTAGHAQKKNFSYKFYGQVRGDLFYNSRANAEIVDGLFHLYPKDKNLDADGNDLNATANGSFYLLYSRLGVDVTGPNIGKAVTTAKLEADFRGSGSNWAVLRIRHAYVNLDWGKSAVLVGQTWHPLFGDVSPQMLNLSTGAPFQPFNRSPQIRYRYTSGKGLQLTGAVLWQLQYLSAGPNGKSEEYIKNSCIPEIYVSADYKVDGLIAGVGMEVLSLKPRQQTTVDDRVYKVNERVTSLSFEAHAKYMTQDWVIAGKTLLASNLTQACMLGGYAVTSVDPHTGEQEYTP